MRGQRLLHAVLIGDGRRGLRVGRKPEAAIGAEHIGLRHDRFVLLHDRTAESGAMIRASRGRQASKAATRRLELLASRCSTTSFVCARAAVRTDPSRSVDIESSFIPSNRLPEAHLLKASLHASVGHAPQHRLQDAAVLVVVDFDRRVDAAHDLELDDACRRRAWRAPGRCWRGCMSSLRPRMSKVS